MESGSLIPSNGQGPRELQAAFPGELSQKWAPGLYPPLPSHESPLREYFRVLIKRKYVVGACVVVIFLLVLIASLRMTPIYDAMGSLAINKVDPGLMNLKDSASASDYYDPADLDTEVQILRSDLLALQVIKQLNLDKRPEFGGDGVIPPANALGQTDSLQLDSPRTSALLGMMKGNLRVALRPNSRIIEIHFTSPNKELAPRVVNTLVNTYIEQNFVTKYQSTTQATDWLSKQLMDLQIRVATSQEKLVRYQKEHSILGIDEKQNIITEKLDDLNKELTAAESDRMEKESIYRLTQGGDPDVIVSATGDSAKNSAGNNDSAESMLLEKLRSQQADLKIQVAELNTQFGPSYPKVLQLNNQLKEIDQQIQLEVRKVAGKVRNRYLAALQRENMLRDAMEKQKQEANKLNESAITYSQLKRELETSRTLYEGLLEKLKEAGVTAGLRSNNVKAVDVARVPMAPSEPNVPRNLAFALLLGLTSGIGLAFLLENLDNTVRTPEQAQAIAGLPALGMIPLGSKRGEETNRRLAVASSKEAVELVTQSRPQSQMAESYRALRTSLLLSSLGAPPKVILVTSAMPQEGKTTTSINCAIVLAQKGVRVLLIDADLRRPGIHKALGMGPRSGLSNVLTGSTEVQPAITRSTLIPSLYVLPAGTPPPNPAELLASVNMRDLIDSLSREYDHIVIDTPPTLSVTDAVVLSTRADAVVLVIRSGKTTKQALRRARELLARVNARVTGVLLNAVDLRSPDYYYYYEYQGKYGGRYYQEDELATDELPKASSTSA
ncbi:MAG TPA: polysaccharide biosynthesis tyrosine autokinase [Terriglobales bacterium]|jgi:capsular exopolysaccharide synthesis family protein